MNKSIRQKVKNLLMQCNFSLFKTLQSSKDNKTILLKDEPTLIKINTKYNKNIPRSAEKSRLEKNDTSSSNTHLMRYKFNSTIDDRDNTPFRKKEKIYYSSKSVSDGEKTSYSKMKIINRTKNYGKFRDKNKRSNGYQDIISKNIEKNKQNLNNPEEYFSGFFNNILSKKKV